MPDFVHEKVPVICLDLPFPTRGTFLPLLEWRVIRLHTYETGLVKVDNQVIRYLMPLLHLFNL